MPEVKNPIRCVGCNKIIAAGIMKLGEIEILCKCGTKNTIKAEPHTTPEVYSGVIKKID